MLAFAGALTWLALGAEQFLPPLFADNLRHIQSTLNIAFALVVLVAVAALAVLWIRRY